MTAALAFRTVDTPAFDWRATLDEIGPQLAQEGRRCDETNEFAAANFELLREREFLALAVPAELGGPGLSRTETAAVLRALAHYCPSTALALAMHTHLDGGRGLALDASEGADRRPAQAHRLRAHPAFDVGRIGLAGRIRQGREGRGRLPDPRPQDRSRAARRRRSCS